MVGLFYKNVPFFALAIDEGCTIRCQPTWFQIFDRVLALHHNEPHLHRSASDKLGRIQFARDGTTRRRTKAWTLVLRGFAQYSARMFSMRPCAPIASRPPGQHPTARTS